MRDIVFVDTETTSLRHDRRVWEIAAIRGADERVLQVRLNDLRLGEADPASLRIGRFHERHKQMAEGGDGEALHEQLALLEFERFARDCVLIGVNPGFDIQALESRMRAHDICSTLHYSPVDMKSMAAGWLAAKGVALPPHPWSSVELSELCGVDVPPERERHTALGDARWVKRWYEALGVTEREAEE